MKLYVTGKNFTYLIETKDDSLMIDRMWSNPDHGKFGYAWDRDDLYLAESQGLTRRKNKSPAKVEEIFTDLPYDGTDRWAAKEDATGPQFARPHQLLNVKGKVYCTDTAHNQIRIFDIATKSWQPIVRILDIPWAKERGINWINSVNFIENHLYFVAHNHGWSSLLVFDQDMNFCNGVERIGFASHNIWKMKDKLWTLSSYEGCLQTTDQQTKISIGGFPRGVAISQSLIAVGVSGLRPTASLGSSPSPPVPNNSMLGLNPQHGVIILNSETLGFVRFMPLPDAGAIYEVRLIDERDHAVHVDPGNEIFRIDA